MGLPEPIEPQPDDDAPATPRESRADWLCGAEEGLESELRSDTPATPAPKLFRPGADAPAEPMSPAPERRREGQGLPAPRLTLPSGPGLPAGEAASRATPGAPPQRAPGTVQPEAPGGFSHGPAMLWEPGGNSLPVLPRGEASPAPHAAPPPAPATELDFPMDDAEERALASVAAAEAATAAAAAATTTRAPQPHAVVAPDAFDIKDAPAPWWMQLPQLLREDRRVQGLAAFVAVVLLALLFWPRGEKSLSIGSIRREATRYDGQSVRVSGRIGEIFEVGGGHAFYLHQGRDTLVVFTRSRTPRRGEGATVVGMISTGFLNGQSGTALFESAKR